MSLTDEEHFDIRYTIFGDIKCLREWLTSEGMLHWYPPSQGDELEGFMRVWMRFHEHKAALTATWKGEPIGMFVLYLMPYRKVAHHCVFQVIVAPDYQKKGVGRALLKNGFHLAKNHFHLQMLHAEIIDESPLVPLLTSLGFTLVTKQAGAVKEEGKYYPRILMETTL